MADQVEESVEIIRRDRDLSREFLADVSHELRTPIAALRTFNELLQEKAGEDPAARAEFLEASGAQLERLDWLAQNLLELSKLDSGLVLAGPAAGRPAGTVDSAVEQADWPRPSAGRSSSRQLPERPLLIRHDPPRLGQVVDQPHRQRPQVHAARRPVRVTARADGRRRADRGGDTGVGIDAAELPHVFERFYRGSRANEARGSGSGLGLAIVRSIVEMHGGTVVGREPRRAGLHVHGHAARGTRARSTEVEPPPRPPAGPGPPLPATSATARLRTWTFLHHREHPALNHVRHPRR